MSLVVLLFQDILTTKVEGEPKVKEVLAMAEKVLPHTAPQGKEVISRETEALRADWEAFIMALEKVSIAVVSNSIMALELCLGQLCVLCAKLWALSSVL